MPWHGLIIESRAMISRYAWISDFLTWISRRPPGTELGGRAAKPAPKGAVEIRDGFEAGVEGHVANSPFLIEEEFAGLFQPFAGAVLAKGNAGLFFEDGAKMAGAEIDLRGHFFERNMALMGLGEERFDFLEQPGAAGSRRRAFRLPNSSRYWANIWRRVPAARHLAEVSSGVKRQVCCNALARLARPAFARRSTKCASRGPSRELQGKRPRQQAARCWPLIKTGTRILTRPEGQQYCTGRRRVTARFSACSGLHWQTVPLGSPRQPLTQNAPSAPGVRMGTGGHQRERARRWRK